MAVPVTDPSGEVRSPARESSTRRALWENAPDPLLTVDMLGVVVACNRTGLEWLGVTADDVVAMPLSTLFTDDDAPRLERLAADGWAGAAEQRFTLLDGRRVSLNASAVEVTGAESHQLTIRDVTNREAVEEAADLRRRLETLAQFAGSLARELNDPMSIVQGRMELLLELGEDSPEAIRRHLGVALTHARRMTATLQNLRLVGRASPPRLQPVELAEALDGAMRLVGPRLDDTEVQLDLEPADLTAGGEPAMYARVFANLLERVLDVGGRGGHLDLVGRRRGGAIKLELHLRGRPRARMRRSHDLDDPLAPLGFTIARTLLESMGGALEPGGGVRGEGFVVTLPLPPRRRSRQKPVESTLLVVGDTVFSDVVADLLAREGYDFCAVPDGEAALLVLDDDPDVGGVITELLLPGMSGLALADEVARRFPALAERRVVVSESNAPTSAHALSPPLTRNALLRALGRRVRARS